MPASSDRADAATVSAVVADNGSASPDPDPGLVADLVTANHILYDQHVVDAFGHVSVRHDKRRDRFLLARSMAPALVTAADILEFDLDGNPLDAGGRAVYLERFIHGEIYRVRPDVGAIVHSHSHAVIPFGVVRSHKLRAIFHMSGFVGTETPIFEIRECAGDGSDLLIRNRELGAALAKSLGPKSAVLMRGHGITVTGPNLREAVYRGVYVDVNARLQLEAIGLGDVNYLTEQEGRAAAAANASQIGRAWEMWRMKVEGRL
ncbi:MAG TPA: class II aldolase/adducin family protein [Xanthobacteraceae bacterium]|jgi:ribulose-5-phosphate 4-epimerase/fuculose-1-phosphate aldolase|nr:class II aldolase/adducin family protein [Xanthobacteraceae bacterium]